jgi:thiol-disulfide isomerase/thioredoxin
LPTRWFVLTALLAVLVAGVTVARHPQPADGPLVPETGASQRVSGRSPFEDMTGKPALDFRLLDLQGNPHTLREHRGQVLMLIFWATWCKSCPLELPHLSEIARALAPQGLVTLSINGEKELAPVEQFARALAFPVLRDPDDRVRAAYDAFAVPRVVIVDRSGRIAAIIRGYQGTATPITRALAEQGMAVPANVNGPLSVPVERVPDR